MLKGSVVEWNDAKGFGFLMAIGSTRKVFFHIRDYPRGQGRPVVGEVMFFDVVKEARGEKAVNLKRSASRATPVSVKPSGASGYTGRWLLALLFAVLIVLLAVLQRIPWWLVGTYAALSLITYVIYAWDKVSARTGKWRTEEQTLQGLSLLGGWPGALLAQAHFRHKTRKESFQSVFWMTVVINCAFLAWVGYVGFERLLMLVSQG